VVAQTARVPGMLAPAPGQVAGLVTAAAVSGLAYRCLHRLRPPPADRGVDESLGEVPHSGRDRFWRRNFAGEQVDLFAGPASVAGLVAGCLVCGRPDAAALAVATGGVGLLDDLAGSADSRGLRGHLRAILRGNLTTGGIKVVGLTVAAALLARSRRPATTASLLDAAVDTALVAGAANLVNLFDLRPGRATKAVVVIAGLMTTSVPPNTAGPVLGALAGTVRADLGGRSMLGDCGANAAGAVLAAGFTAMAPRQARVVALATVTALTLVSERVSFSRVIDANPWLRRLDRWGRPPGG
jgi:UDP-GlcNAc:undecaprenyl-phosphate/decaprenyl-phosphate GlcNAc-1-phosphate transferase